LVTIRESTKLEFKISFTKNVKSYIRSICAFANNSGGHIIFGVQDKPRRPVGLQNKLKDFQDYDGKEFETILQNYLSTKVEFEFTNFSQEINGQELEFGILEIKESKIKPVICKISDGDEKLREGAIYFRYHAKNEEIKAQDLINLIQGEKDKEKELWIKHITKISQVGVSNIGLFNYDGEMYAGDKKIIIDRETLNNIKFIKEGQFVEKDGAPALILKGEINNLNTLEVFEKRIVYKKLTQTEIVDAVKKLGYQMFSKYEHQKFWITKWDNANKRNNDAKNYGELVINNQWLWYEETWLPEVIKYCKEKYSQSTNDTKTHDQNQ
jgi:hypothetical protein